MPLPACPTAFSQPSPGGLNNERGQQLFDLAMWVSAYCGNRRHPIMYRPALGTRPPCPRELILHFANASPHDARNSWFDIPLLRGAAPK